MMAVPPSTAIVAAIVGSPDNPWAIRTIFLGCVLFLFLAGTWVTAANLRGAVLAIGFALLGALLLVIGMLSATRLADEISPTPTTITQP